MMSIYRKCIYSTGERKNVTLFASEFAQISNSHYRLNMRKEIWSLHKNQLFFPPSVVAFQRLECCNLIVKWQRTKNTNLTVPLLHTLLQTYIDVQLFDFSHTPAAYQYNYVQRVLCYSRKALIESIAVTCSTTSLRNCIHDQTQSLDNRAQ